MKVSTNYAVWNYDDAPERFNGKRRKAKRIIKKNFSK